MRGLFVSRLAGAFGGDSEESEDGAGLRIPRGLGALVSASAEAFGELRMDKADELDWLTWFLLGWIDGLMMMLTNDDDGPASRLV